MQTLFQYNWQVRKDWFKWCEQLTEEQLLSPRTGGVGNILKTLFHIVDVEYSWIMVIQGKPDFQEPFEKYATLKAVRKLSSEFHEEVSTFLANWTPDLDDQPISVDWGTGTKTFTYGEILRHALAHEIHHMGQLSVWSRELGLQPITANLINRGFGVEKIQPS